MSAGDEDQGLRDNGNLEVDDHVELWVVLIYRISGAQGHAEFAAEPCRFDDNHDQSNTERKWKTKVRFQEITKEKQKRTSKQSNKAHMQ